MDAWYCIRLLLFFLSFGFGKSKNFGVPKFEEPISNLTVPIGREAVIKCVINDLFTYKVAWLRVDTQTILTIHSHVITKNHRIAVTHNDRRIWYLHIRDVKESDRGWYMCQINTDPMKSQVGFLDVVVPPDILDYGTSTDMLTTEGANVTLQCSASGSPVPSITWRRETGKSIIFNGQQVTSVDGPYLNLTKVNRLHMGPYLCIAANGVPPTVSKRIMLSVQFPPAIKAELTRKGAEIGQSVTLECNSEAFPKGISYWTKSGKIIPQGEKYQLEFVENNYYKILMKLTINSLESIDFGIYTCISKNFFQDTKASIQLYEVPMSSTMVPSTSTTKTTTTLTTPAIVEEITHGKQQSFNNTVIETNLNMIKIQGVNKVEEQNKAELLEEKPKSILTTPKGKARKIMQYYKKNEAFKIVGQFSQFVFCAIGINIWHIILVQY